MAKSNMALPVVCAVLGLHIVASLVLKSVRLNDIRIANEAADNNDNASKFKGADVNNPIADVVLLVVAGFRWRVS